MSLDTGAQTDLLRLLPWLGGEESLNLRRTEAQLSERRVVEEHNEWTENMNDTVVW